ncbi:MAG: lysophospholipase [Ruminococcus sp.]|nr:lysophospholipase [Ruminococcus sp.]
MNTYFKGTAAMLAALAAALPCIGSGTLTAGAEVISNPVISRNCPVYSGSGQATAANDEHYFSFWNGTAPDYLAYDLSDVPEENRKTVNAVWYNTSTYDSIGLYVSRNMEPSDYTIEINAAPGGDYPEDGWETVLTVADNTLSSRQHIVDMEGYNWIRINITGVDGKDSGNASINFDIHDVSEGVTDSWIFFGDSITAGGMNNCYGTGFATHINQLDERYFPVQENGGIGGITSTDGRNNIDRWLSTYPGTYVSIAYGTNDAWGNQSGAQKYYENTVYMIEAVLAAGKIPVLPKIPYATEPGVGDYLDDYNAMIDRIYEEYPKIIKGPDFDAYFREHPDMLSGDGVHPSGDGYAEMRRIWAETMYENVYCADSPAFVQGDVNLDGVFSIADAVMMQKHLTGKGSLNSLENGDLCKDGVINIFDLSLMKKSLFA